ncbi:fibronectin type III-like domain-contianing protein [Actinoplanes sp. NPDC049596]|uniref:fibronectin type III-like domain-contianing protein n=1 Tax=unclassified Actinoplanes TaxID=2626549 RepID=UPI00341D57A6
MKVSGDGRHSLKIRFTVENTGRRAGTEVAQAYVSLPAVTGEPPSRLIGWERVTLQPGQRRTVEVSLSRSDLNDLHLLQYWDSTWRTASGVYGVTVGGSSSGGLRTSFVVPRP